MWSKEEMYILLLLRLLVYALSSETLESFHAFIRKKAEQPKNQILFLDLSESVVHRVNWRGEYRESHLPGS